jgi:hypothetical protein
MAHYTITRTTTTTTNTTAPANLVATLASQVHLPRFSISGGKSLAEVGAKMSPNTAAILGAGLGGGAKSALLKASAIVATGVLQAAIGTMTARSAAKAAEAHVGQHRRVA